MSFQNKTLFVTIFLYLGVTLNAFANPQGEKVVSGSATFTNTPNTLTVNTSSNKTIIDYDSFSIAADETTRFNQPSTSSVVLNRVIGVDPSSIYGTLSSNGSLFLVNPNGIIFGPGSQVNAPAILASTLDISNNDFLNGNYNFSKNGTNSYVINQGRLAASPGGYIALLSQAVNNQGTIIAPLGSVALAAGDKLTLALDSQSQISVAVDDAVKNEVLGPNGQQINSAIQNSGTINANGGKVLLTTKVLNDVFDYAVNNSGITDANSFQENNGVVDFLASGAPVTNSGTINATQATINSQDGIYSTGLLIIPDSLTLISTGNIYSLGMLESSSLFERGNTFQVGGTFDPGDADIKNVDNAITYSSNTNVSGTITDAANIIVDPGVTLSMTGDTTFNAGGAFTMDPTATINGGGYNLTINALNASTLGNISYVDLLTLGLISGSTPITFTSNSSSTFQVNTVQTNYNAVLSRSVGSGTISDPIMIYSDSNAPGGLQYIPTSGLSLYYEQANNIDASETSSWNSGAGFDPIGTSSTPFTGSFNGNNYTISNLFIYLPSTNNVGLFGDISGLPISNVGLTNVNITGQDNTGGLAGGNTSATISDSYVTGSVTGDLAVGELVGDNNSTISNSYAIGMASGVDYVGGLVGQAGTSSSISNTYAMGSVSGDNDVGGLVGENYNSASISESYATATVTGTGGDAGGLVGANFNSGSISSSYATGSVTGNLAVGGFAGDNNATISNSYETGSVLGDSYVGGLVGQNATSSSTIANSYATGSVTESGGSDVGGLVGENYSSSTISNSYATGSVSASGSNVGGLIGYDDGSTTLTNNWWYNSQSYGIGNNGTAQSTGQWQLAGAASDFYGTGSGVGNLYSTWSFGISGGWDSFSGTYPHLYWEWSPTITTLLQLQNINLDLGGNYTLGNDIDATGTEGWNSGAGFVPIGNSSTQFTGTFDGNSYTISNLFINVPSTDYVGLFGYTSGATISNVGLTNANVTGQNDVGGLVGWNYDSSISNSYVSGSVTGSGGASNVGGLVGVNFTSSISDSYATGTVSGTDQVGGLVGENVHSASISNSYATGEVSGSGNYEGGLVGYQYDSSVSNSYATGTVTGSSSEVGGLMGENDPLSTITNSYATGSVTGSGGASNVGGLVGVNFTSSISDSYATGTVSGTDQVGGLVGENVHSASISNSYATGEVSGSGNYEGGLVGYQYDSSVSNSYATGTVTGSSSEVGGLMGENDPLSTITNSYATGSVTGSSDVGGLIGYDSGSNTLTNNWWYNSQSYGIGNNGTAQSTGNWQLASALSDFYSSSFAVYTGATPWDFTYVWYPPSSTYPLLR